MPVLETAPISTPPTVRSSLRRVLFTGILAGLAIGGGLEIYNVLAGSNCHAVVPGVLYRCAQPSARRLARLIQKHKIRTVVNLRGVCDACPWFLKQARVTARLDVSQEDLSFSAGRLPPVPAIRTLVQIIDQSEYPILFHCNRGIDRTGMATAIALLLRSDISVDEARETLSLRHGHLAMGRTAYMDRFFDFYERWLTEQGLEHSRSAFRQWIENDYCPGKCRCRIALLEPEKAHRLPAHEWLAIKVRCTNTSIESWSLRPGYTAGVHCGFMLFNAEDRPIIPGWAGMFRAEVPPGESIDLTLAVPPLPRGNYRLRVDMIEAQHGFFFQTGSEPFSCQVEVP